MLEASLNAADPEVVSKTSATIPNSLSSVNDEHSPPTPFNSANFEQDNIAKKIAKDEMNQKPAALSDTNEEEKRVIPLVEESVNIPTSEHIESMDEIRGITNTNTGSNNGRGWEDIESRVARDIESQTNTDVNDSEGSINNDSLVGTEDNVEVVPTPVNQEAGDTDIHIPVAWKVDDNNDEDDDRSENEVYDATPLEPTLPWWKQKRAKIFFGVVIVLVGALVVALGVSLSQSNNPEPVSTNSTILFVTTPPTISIAPSTSPPTITYECFGPDGGGKDGVLYNAVRAYVNQDCANIEACSIGLVYGRPINSWCVENIKSMNSLFRDMDTFNESISDWNTSSVTDMGYMFYNARSFNQDVSNFNTSSVTNMNGMFSGATKFNQDVSNFNTSSAMYMGYMFYEATSFDGDVSSFDTSRVTDMGGMFSRTTSFNGNVSNFDTSSVTDMAYMF